MSEVPRAKLKVVTDGRFLCVEVTNLGTAATFSGIVQPGRGSASAAIARPALWHDAATGERRLETGQSATIRVAQRDRPPAGHEDDDRRHVHPEGSQAWRMCYFKHGGAALERICPVVRRDASPEHDDGVVLTVVADPAMQDRTVVKSVSLDGARAIDLDTRDEFRVLDSPRHYHAKD
jgi:hypothetical protein